MHPRARAGWYEGGAVDGHVPDGDDGSRAAGHAYSGHHRDGRLLPRLEYRVHQPEGLL